jgi:hypothetical protein
MDIDEMLELALNQAPITEEVAAIGQDAATWGPSADAWLNDDPKREKEEWTQ